MAESADVAIVGGGAAGLTAAIFAAEAAPGRRIVVLEGAKQLGAKILVAGGGRCNVTHDVVFVRDFNGSANVVRNILAAFTVETTIAWFESLGVTLKREETGKLFPTTDSARTVLNALLKRCADLQVIIQADRRVRAIRVTNTANESFTIDHEQGATVAGRLVLATGGRSLPRTGSDGAGWEIVRRLGHSVTPTFAALAPLVLDDRFFHAELSGIALDVELLTFVEGKVADRRTGSLLWTHFGVSGPVVMDASRHWIIAHETAQPTRLLCNLLPGETFESAERWLMGLATSRARASILNATSARLPERVAAAIVRHAGVELSTPCGQLSRDSRRSLVHALTALSLPVIRHRGWNYAEVTAGGVPLKEINFRTMESRKVPGLHLAGEILDCDGRIGGFNFQWAWATGYLAGKACGTASID